MSNVEDCRVSGPGAPEILTSASLYATLPPEVGGAEEGEAAISGTSDRSVRSALSVGSLLPQIPGSVLLHDDLLHARLRNRTLLLDKEQGGGGSLTHRTSKDSRHNRNQGEAKVSRKALKRARAAKVVVPKEERQFKIYEPLAQLWRDYAESVVAGGDAHTSGERIIRMDFHGAEIEVRRARDPGLIGLRGILIVERANTVQVVTRKDRLVTIPKNAAVVAIHVLDKIFEISLPMLPYRASERSARKLKKKHLPVF